MPGGRTAEACGLAKLIREGASVGEVRDWFDFGGSKHAINQSCWRRTPLGEAVLRLDLDILNLLFAKGGDVNAIDSPFLSDDDDSVFVELAGRFDSLTVQHNGSPWTIQDGPESLALPLAVEILLKNGLDPNSEPPGSRKTEVTIFVDSMNKATKDALDWERRGIRAINNHSRLALRRCIRLFYESGTDLSEARHYNKPLVLYVNPLDRPLLVQLGADLSEAFVYARDRGQQDDLYQLLAMTNSVFDGEAILPVIVPDRGRLRLVDPRTRSILRLHERIVPVLRPLKTDSRDRVWRRLAAAEYDEANQSWPLPPGASGAAFFDLQLEYIRP